MKINNLQRYILKLNETNWDDARNYSYDDDDYDKDSPKYEEEEEEEESYFSEEPSDDDDEEDHLCYLIRSMFSNSSIIAQVERDDLDITVFVFPQKKERMKNILKTFDVVHKLKTDILPQYDSEMELYESKQGYPIFKFDFFYGSGDKDDNLPF
jgi:FtsZ-interacting cell division protein YlmF